MNRFSLKIRKACEKMTSSEKKKTPKGMFIITRKLSTETSSLNLASPNKIWIEITLFRLIPHQTDQTNARKTFLNIVKSLICAPNGIPSFAQINR